MLSWDDLDQEYDEDGEVRKPYFVVMDGGDEEETKIEWLNNEFSFRLKNSRARLDTYDENYAYLSGIHFKSQYSPNRYIVENEYNTKNPKVVDNLVIEAIQEKIAKMIRYDPNFSAIPSNSEWDDDIASKAAKKMVDTRWYDLGVKKLFTLDQFYAFLYGTSFIKGYWDEEEGPLNEQTGERAGDVNLSVVPPSRIFPEVKEHWKDVNNLFEVEYKCPYELAADYPDAGLDPTMLASDEDEGDDGVMMPDRKKNKGKVAVKHYYQRSTKHVEEGVIITFIKDKILDEKPMEIDDYDGRQQLPFKIHIDMNWPKTFWGKSFISFIKQLQDQYNGLASAAARAFFLASLPKWMVPWGSCDIKTLNNGSTVVRFKGGREPRLATHNPLPEAVFTQQDRLKAAIDRKSKVYNIYRREQKIDLSGIALQYLDEQESEAVSSDIANRADIILKTAQMTIDFMQFYYPKTDSTRLIKIFGQDDTYMAQKLDTGIFASKYTMILQNSPSLPQHKSSKMQLMMDAEQARPNMIKDETFLDLLGIADEKQYTDLITVSSRAARYENDVMLKMEGIPAPEKWEDHITHYPLHLKKLQERKYKGNLKEGAKLSFEKHIKATEYLMWQKAQGNPAFRQQLMAIPLFPVFFKIPSDDVKRANIIAAGGDPSIVQRERNNAVSQEFMEGAVINPDGSKSEFNKDPMEPMAEPQMQPPEKK